MTLMGNGFDNSEENRCLTKERRKPLSNALSDFFSARRRRAMKEEKFVNEVFGMERKGKGGGGKGREGKGREGKGREGSGNNHLTMLSRMSEYSQKSGRKKEGKERREESQNTSHTMSMARLWITTLCNISLYKSLTTQSIQSRMMRELQPTNTIHKLTPTGRERNGKVINKVDNLRWRA